MTAAAKSLEMSLKNLHLFARVDSSRVAGLGRALPEASAG